MTLVDEKADDEDEGFKMKITPIVKTQELVLDSVLTMAADTVEIRRNDSALYDEMLAHRIGLVPLTTDLPSYKLRDECSCSGEGCMSCEVKLTLKKKGPCNVYASDFETSDPKVKVAV